MSAVLLSELDVEQVLFPTIHLSSCLPCPTLCKHHQTPSERVRVDYDADTQTTTLVWTSSVSSPTASHLLPLPHSRHYEIGIVESQLISQSPAGSVLDDCPAIHHHDVYYLRHCQCRGTKYWHHFSDGHFDGILLGLAHQPHLHILLLRLRGGKVKGNDHLFDSMTQIA